ncbi:hypothetical protein ACHQM5_001285 [Ranunculus cassubicifolius]
MATSFPVSLLLLISLLALTSTASSAVTKPSTPSNFIKSSCSITRYPALCINSLSTYSSSIQTSPRTMAQTALAVSLSRARSAKTFIVQASKSKGMKKREYQAVKDCIVNIGSCVDKLSKSITELGKMGKGGDFFWHMSNVQTWASAALTDENTCMDGFSGKAMDGRLKTAIKGRITNVAQVTSNALALVNRFAERH